MRERVNKLALAWVLKAASHHKFKNWFPINPASQYSLRTRELYHVPFAFTERYRRSPLVSLARLLNGHVASLTHTDVNSPGANLILPNEVIAFVLSRR